MDTDRDWTAEEERRLLAEERLAKAAPKLLSALRRLIAYTGMDEADEDCAEAEGETFASIWREATAAIAEAEGKP